MLDTREDHRPDQDLPAQLGLALPLAIVMPTFSCMKPELLPPSAADCGWGKIDDDREDE